ncbi:MAG TPA: polysaccharide biosynthesis tyrosine autokinase [Sedimentisphaerales bacterium]|nr:polysaccharide biosynthesis tyrosine autokinase [Sedimentisphaerales bacterium]
MERPTNLPASGVARPAVVRSAAVQTGMTLTPKDVMDIMRRHVLLIISFTALGFIVGGAAWYLLLRFSPRYTATTFVEVLPPGLRDPARVESPIVGKDIQFQERASKAAIFRQQTLHDELLRNSEVRATDWFARHGGDIDALRGTLRRHLGAIPERETNFIRISMTTNSPGESALIANQAVILFVARQTDEAQQGVGGRLAELRRQLGTLESDIGSAERGIEAIRMNAAAAGLTGVTGRDADFRGAISQKLADLEVQQNDVQRQIAQLQTSVATYQQQTVGPISPQTQRLVESDPVMISLANQLSAYEGDLARKRGTLGDAHRDVRQTEEAIRRLVERRRDREAEIAETFRQSTYFHAVDELRAMTDELRKLDEMRSVAELRQKDLERFQLVFEQAVSRRDELRRRRDDINNQITTYTLIYGDPETPQVRRAGVATEPLRVSSPKWEFYLPGGFILGLLVGLGLSFLIELLNDFVRTPSDVKRYIQTPLLGVIYHVQEDEQAKGVDLCHVIRQAPYSITSECYRHFRTNLKLSIPAESLKSILVTSGQAGEGKTCAASNLAATLVAEGKKVLFIDANLRRPTSQAVFPPQEGSSRYGLSNVLCGQCQPAQAVRGSGVEGLDVVDVGTATSSPAEMLGSQAMKHVLEEYERTYDHIIIDGPPVLLVSEAKVLASMVRSVILVLNATSTTRGAGARVIRELGEIRANVVGGVLVQARSLKGGYFYELARSYEKYQAGSPVSAAG